MLADSPCPHRHNVLYLTYVSHLGTGTIADCWEVKVANIIVANPNLMDNHQAVFAEDTARDHPTVILGRLG